jgi:methylmalonyl-CoA/ethylmalonyl-CoA epimerase
MQFHHVGVACSLISAETATLSALGYAPEGPVVEDPIQKVRLQFFVGGGPRLELIEPISADSPIQGVLRRGGKFYHVAYEVEHFDRAVGELKDKRFTAVAPPAPAVAFGGRRIIFMISSTLTLIELIEAGPSESQGN